MISLITAVQINVHNFHLQYTRRQPNKTTHIETNTMAHRYTYIPGRICEPIAMFGWAKPSIMCYLRRNNLLQVQFVNLFYNFFFLQF